MKSIQIAVAVFLFASVLQATNLQPMMKHPDNISGSLAGVRAFQAMREGNINALIETLRSKPNLVNETLTFKTEKEEFKLRLIHVGPLTKSADILRVLAGSDARIAAKDSNGRNVAHYASFAVPELNVLFGFTPHEDGYAAALILKMLYDLGIDPDVPDESGRRPLHYAAAAGDPFPIRQLLAFGVEIDPLDNEGYSPIKLAVNKLNLSAAEVLQTSGSMAKIGKLDYLSGFKNRVAGLVYDNTIGIASFVGLVVVVKFSRWLMSSQEPRVDSPKKPNTKAATKDEDSDDEDDGDGHPKVFKIAPAPAVGLQGSSGGGSVSAVRPRGASVSQILAAKPRAHTKAPVPNVEAQEGATTLARLLNATKELNHRIRDQEPVDPKGNQEIIARNAARIAALAHALEQADALLLELAGAKLGEREEEARRGLSGAIRSVALHLNPEARSKQQPRTLEALRKKVALYPEALKTKATSLRWKWDKYRTKR